MPVFSDNVRQLNDVLALLVLLRLHIGLLVFPAEYSFAIGAVDVGHSMRARV